MGNNSTSSGLLAADTAVSARPAAVTSVTLVGDGTNAATVVVYDNATTNSGKAVAKLAVSATNPTAVIQLHSPISCINGIYADLTGTGAGVIVTYHPQ